HELGPAPGKASRGDVVVQLLAKRGAPEAAEAARRLHPARYRRFTLLVADREAAFVATCDGHALAVQRLAPGAHMLTPEGVDVSGAPRVDAYAEAFRAAAPPDPERGDWAAWIELLRREDREDPHRAMTVVTDAGFGTVASTLVAIPAPAQAPIVLFASGPPTRTPFQRYVPDRFAAAVSNAHAR
ncbi:MAG: hypothetical protein JOZ24_02980, partial [Candidatus Eremiobacteraeota bacterium]|nr:hypothetical protein [Candidatus Eremiobacteraeota bacterium]